VSGVVEAIALYLGFRHAPFSVASSVSAVGAAAFSILAGLLLGERPGALSLAGIALALPAIAAVSASASRVDASQANGSVAATASALSEYVAARIRRIRHGDNSAGSHRL
jgi:drug/metabolite transporter (DMT)-like permease